MAGWSGLSLDEAVNRLSNDYTELIGEIAAAMHRQHRLVRLMAPVRDSDDVDAATTDIAPYLLNYGALAQYVDQLVLKAYDFNFATGNPGPIAPFTDVAKVLAYVHSYGVSWGKLAVAEPLYAYNWTVNKKGDIAAGGQRPAHFGHHPDGYSGGCRQKAMAPKRKPKTGKPNIPTPLLGSRTSSGTLRARSRPRWHG